MISVAHRDHLPCKNYLECWERSGTANMSKNSILGAIFKVYFYIKSNHLYFYNICYNGAEKEEDTQ